MVVVIWVVVIVPLEILTTVVMRTRTAVAAANAGQQSLPVAKLLAGVRVLTI